MTLVVGLDIGGSGSRARVDVDGETVAEASAGSASVTAAGRDAAGAALSALLAELAHTLGERPDAVCAGAAGSESGGGREWLVERLSELTGAPRVSVVTDAALVLPAAGRRCGVAVIAGTGSIVHASDGARVARAGGWGYLLGDEGGGYRLVAEAVRVVLGRRDAGEDPGRLGAVLAPDGDLDALVAGLYVEPSPRRWAARVPALLASGDPAVDTLLGDGMGALAGQAAIAAGRLGLAGAAAPVVLAGGLLAPPAPERPRAVLSAVLQTLLPASPVQVLTEPAVAGAVALARAAAP